MTSAPFAALSAVGAALAIVLLAGPVLRRLPEPEDGEGKPLYRELPTPAFVIGCAMTAALAATVSTLFVPARAQPLWWVLAVPGVLLAAIDARTTWLPLRLTRVAWMAMAAAAVLGLLLGGGLPQLLRAGFGAIAAGGLYLAVWLASRGGFGFGDVRFAPLLGAATAAVSWQLLFWSLLAGSLVGGVVGVVRLAQRRRALFPYAPPMLGGAYLACVAAWLA